MKTGDVELNADELIQALTDVRDHVAGRRKITMRTTSPFFNSTAVPLS